MTELIIFGQVLMIILSIIGGCVGLALVFHAIVEAFRNN